MSLLYPLLPSIIFILPKWWCDAVLRQHYHQLLDSGKTKRHHCVKIILIIFWVKSIIYQIATCLNCMYIILQNHRWVQPVSHIFIRKRHITALFNGCLYKQLVVRFDNNGSLTVILTGSIYSVVTVIQTVGLYYSNTNCRFDASHKTI